MNFLLLALAFFLSVACTDSTAESRFRKQDMAGNWQQCGGINWTGATQCGPGYYCFQQNQWYSQCQPGTAGIVPSSSPTRTPPPTNPTQLSVLASCLGVTLSSQLFSPLNPGSGYASYDWLRTSNNNRLDRHPAAVLMIQNISTVSQAVKCAQLSGIQPVVRSGGHSYEGLSSLDGKLVIDVSNCNSITRVFEDPVGSGNYKATFESGIRLGKFYTDLWNKGQWSFTAGECAWVGAGGHMTGGGQGMQTRLYGLASDQMTAIDVVLASGVSVTATGSNSYSDLFWALRGAGSSSFGVVTRFTVNIFQMPQNAVFYLYFKPTIRMLQIWQTYFVNFPNELGAYIHIQSNEFYINGHYLGTLDGLKTILAPILSDPALTWSELKSCSSIEARSYVRGGENMGSTSPIDTTSKGALKSKSDFIAQLIPDTVLQTIVDILVSAQNVYFGSHLLGGTGVYSTMASDATAYPARSAWYCIEYGTWGYYGVGSVSYNQIQSIQSALAPYSTSKYYNWLDLESPISSYFGGNMARLMTVKAKYDPGNFFNGPLTIPLPPPVTSPTAIPSLLFVPSLIPSILPSSTIPTVTPTVFPSSSTTSPITPTTTPTTAQSIQPSYGPTVTPNKTPTAETTNQPTTRPTLVSSSVPTSIIPSKVPTVLPSAVPTTVKRTTVPTVLPSATPTTVKPNTLPTVLPSATPTTVKPSTVPTVLPSATPTTVKPTTVPTVLPSATPTTAKPSKVPSTTPTTGPTIRPSTKPSAETSLTPTTFQPSSEPTVKPSAKPTTRPTIKPSSSTPSSSKPTVTPSSKPTYRPSNKPTAAPTA